MLFHQKKDNLPSVSTSLVAVPILGLSVSLDELFHFLLAFFSRANGSKISINLPRNFIPNLPRSLLSNRPCQSAQRFISTFCVPHSSICRAVFYLSELYLFPSLPHPAHCRRFRRSNHSGYWSYCWKLMSD